LGREIKTVYLTKGSFDLAVFIEMPGDEQLASFVLKLSETRRSKPILKTNTHSTCRSSLVDGKIPSAGLPDNATFSTFGSLQPDSRTAAMSAHTEVPRLSVMAVPSP
jgi:hypothetical protein